jgi:hypothetical protein
VLPHPAATTAAGKGEDVVEVGNQQSDTLAPATLDWLNDDLFAA